MGCKRRLSEFQSKISQRCLLQTLSSCRPVQFLVRLSKLLVHKKDIDIIWKGPIANDSFVAILPSLFFNRKHVEWPSGPDSPVQRQMQTGQVSKGPKRLIQIILVDLQLSENWKSKKRIRNCSMSGSRTASRNLRLKPEWWIIQIVSNIVKKNECQ